jgi:hypothetical protein
MPLQWSVFWPLVWVMGRLGRGSQAIELLEDLTQKGIRAGHS